MAKFVVGIGNPDNAARPIREALAARRQIASASPQSNIKIKKREAPAFDPQLQQRLRQAQGAGNGQAGQGAGLGQDVAVQRCIKCNKGVVPHVDAMMTEEGEGPFCKPCWTHVWVTHTYANLPEGPQCQMGIRFNRGEWRAINDGIDKLVMDWSGQQTFPPPAVVDGYLTNIKKSKVCPQCHKNIVFTLALDDFKIPGVNVAWPADRPLPWQMQQIQQTQAWAQAPAQVPGMGQPQMQQQPQQHQHYPQMPPQQAPQQPQQQMPYPGMGSPMPQFPQPNYPQQPQQQPQLPPPGYQPQPQMPPGGWPRR